MFFHLIGGYQAFLGDMAGAMILMLSPFKPGYTRYTFCPNWLWKNGLFIGLVVLGRRGGQFMRHQFSAFTANTLQAEIISTASRDFTSGSSPGVSFSGI
jgi:hypothetical protein